MVQTDVSQLTAECTDWRQILRNYRDEFHEAEKALQQICRQSLQKDDLPEVEHFQNQFDIQLKNIHDIKQEIKSHERRVQFEEAENFSDDINPQHEKLLKEFLHLESRLQELRNDFKNFISKISC